MIRIIREGSQKYPWLLKIIMGVIAVTFIVGMGWFGFEATQLNTVAVVGPYKISLDEYRRAYNNAYRFYRDQLKQEDIDEASLKQTVLHSLIEGKTWDLAVEEFGLSISPEELRDSIVAQKAFQRDDGTFDPQYYQRILAANRLTPNQYETQRTNQLLTDKARLLVQDSTALTPAELEEVQALAARQAPEGEEPDAATVERIRLQFLFQKKQRSLQAFQAAMLGTVQVETHEELL